MPLQQRDVRREAPTVRLRADILGRRGRSVRRVTFGVIINVQVEATKKTRLSLTKRTVAYRSSLRCSILSSPKRSRASPRTCRSSRCPRRRSASSRPAGSYRVTATTEDELCGLSGYTTGRTKRRRPSPSPLRSRVACSPAERQRHGEESSCDRRARLTGSMRCSIVPLESSNIPLSFCTRGAL